MFKKDSMLKQMSDQLTDSDRRKTTLEADVRKHEIDFTNKLLTSTRTLVDNDVMIGTIFEALQYIQSCLLAHLV